MQLNSGYILSIVKDLLLYHEEKEYINAILKILCCFEVERNFTPTPNTSIDPIIAVISNIVSRGLPTLPSLLIEDTYSDAFNISERIVPDKTGNILYNVKEGIKEYERLFWDALAIIDPRIAPNENVFFKFESWENHPSNAFEADFFINKAPMLWGDYIFQLIEPQRSINSILNSSSKEKDKYETELSALSEQFYAQCVDFAIELPKYSGNSKGLVIEIDGSQHQDKVQANLDCKRDKIVKRKGWADTVRINTNELSNISGGKISAIKTFLEHPYAKACQNNYNHPLWKRPKGLEALQIILGPLALARLQKTLVELMLANTLSLSDDNWRIAVIERDVPCAELAVKDLQEYLENLLRLEGKGRKVPNIILKVYNTKEFSECKLKAQDTELIDAPKEYFEADIVIDISMLQRAGFTDIPAAIMEKLKFSKYLSIRSCHSFKEPRRILSARPIKYKIPSDQNDDALTYFVQNIFRKNEFRSGQINILRKTLNLENVIALLPTGAGKSLTYQLSALLQPGQVLIVDPLKSLMRDQIENLNQLGIDSTIFINSSISAADREIACEKMNKGFYQFIFVSPERLQIEEFRNYLKKAYDSYFTYCIVDEAHCVSEWGHDFRTSYLRLGFNIRKYCRTLNDSLPIIALTGTASFSVLSDVQRELDIIEESCIIAPSSYARKELQLVPVPVNISPAIQDWELNSKAKLASLTALIDGIHKLEWEQNKEYKDVDGYFSDELIYKNTGIVFCPHVGGHFGVENVSACLKNKYNSLKASIALYAGSSSELDDEDLSKIQDDFKSDKIKILAATKAFGMGIDKPNIRFTVHFNMPQSIEAYYQEVGRAGRDREKAYCYILYPKPDPQKENSSLDKNLMMTFYNNSFKGKEKELTILLNLLNVPGNNSSPSIGILPILNKLQDGETKVIQIKFINKAFNALANYLKEVNRFFSVDVIHNSYNYTTTSDEYVNNLRKYYYKYSRKNIKFDKGHISYIENLYNLLRNDNDTFKAVYRLSVLGVIEEYSIDYNAKLIIAIVRKREITYYKNNLINYIGRYVSQEEKNVIKNKIDIVEDDKVISTCCEALIDFVYNKIASKRKEAINEMESAIIYGIEGGNFAENINTYFDSKYTSDLRSAVFDNNIEIVWKYLEVTQGASDELNHLRGACDRLLIENPESPPLLLMRAFAKLLIINYSKSEAIEDFEKGIGLYITYLNWNRKEKLQCISRFIMFINRYNSEMSGYLMPFLIEDHAAWLTGFNKTYLQEVQNG